MILLFAYAILPYAAQGTAHIVVHMNMIAAQGIRSFAVRIGMAAVVRIKRSNADEALPEDGVALHPALPDVLRHASRA